MIKEIQKPARRRILIITLYMFTFVAFCAHLLPEFYVSAQFFFVEKIIKQGVKISLIYVDLIYTQTQKCYTRGRILRGTILYLMSS